MASPRSPEKHNRHQRIKSLKIVVETSDKNQYSYFFILNSFLNKAKKNNEVGLRYGVWGQAPAGGGRGMGGGGTLAQLINACIC